MTASGWGGGRQSGQGSRHTPTPADPAGDPGARPAPPDTAPSVCSAGHGREQSLGTLHKMDSYFPAAPKVDVQDQGTGRSLFREAPRPESSGCVLTWRRGEGQSGVADPTPGGSTLMIH